MFSVVSVCLLAMMPLVGHRSHGIYLALAPALALLTTRDSQPQLPADMFKRVYMETVTPSLGPRPIGKRPVGLQLKALLV